MEMTSFGLLERLCRQEVGHRQRELLCVLRQNLVPVISLLELSEQIHKRCSNLKLFIQSIFKWQHFLS